MASTLDSIKHVVLVLSGKGGVGKSTVACQTAMALAHEGRRVGLLDVDICGPSVPKICGVEDASVRKDAAGLLVPVQCIPKPAAVSADQQDAEQPTTLPNGGSLIVMSIAYLLPSKDSAVVWRGPRKDAMIKQFIEGVRWGPLDVLVVDTPPGTSDEHLSLCEALQRHDPSGAVVVTTPQDVSTDDVRKELSFCHKLNVRCLGLVENMSGYVCPHCAECTPIFSQGGGKRLADEYEIKFLGAVPIDPTLSLAEDAGECFTQKRTESGEYASPAVRAMLAVVEGLNDQLTRVEQLRAAMAEGRQ